MCIYIAYRTCVNAQSMVDHICLFLRQIEWECCRLPWGYVYVFDKIICIRCMCKLNGGGGGIFWAHLVVLYNANSSLCCHYRMTVAV